MSEDAGRVALSVLGEGRIETTPYRNPELFETEGILQTGECGFDTLLRSYSTTD